MKAETVLDETRLKRRTGSPRQRIELLRWKQSARRAQLVIADHVHEFDTAKGCRSRPERFGSQHWPRNSLDGSVILSNDKGCGDAPGQERRPYSVFRRRGAEDDRQQKQDARGEDRQNPRRKREDEGGDDRATHG